MPLARYARAAKTPVVRAKKREKTRYNAFFTKVTKITQNKQFCNFTGGPLSWGDSKVAKVSNPDKHTAERAFDAHT